MGNKQQNQDNRQPQSEELYFKEKRDKLHKLEQNYKEANQTVGLTQFSINQVEDFQKKMDKVTKYINKTKIYIVFMGTISSGKSTFINALLGQQLLPSSNQSCTTQVAQIGHQNTNQNQETTISINEFSFASLEQASNPNMGKINIKTQSYFHTTLNKDLQNRVYFIDTPGIDIYGLDIDEYLKQFEKIHQQIEYEEYSFRINVWICDYTTFDRDKRIQSEIITSLRKKVQESQQQLNQNQEINQIQQSNDGSNQMFFIINKFDQRRNNEDKPLEEIYTDIQNVFDLKDFFKISASNALNYNIMNYGTKDAQDIFIKNEYKNNQTNLGFADESKARESYEKQYQKNTLLLNEQDFKEFMSKTSLQIKKALDEQFDQLLNEVNESTIFLKYGEQLKLAKQQLTSEYITTMIYIKPYKIVIIYFDQPYRLKKILSAESSIHLALFLQIHVIMKQTQFLNQAQLLLYLNSLTITKHNFKFIDLIL